MTKYYDSLPKIAKLLLQFFLGAFVGGVYRIARFIETKNTTTLIAGVLCLIPPIDFVAWVIDFITMLTDEKIKYFAD